MNTINGKGWFVYSVSAIASRDIEAIQEANKSYYGRLEEGGLALRILLDLEAIECMMISRVSRNGAHVLEHPILGQLSWKAGTDFRTAKRYMILWLNGKEVLSVWPKAGHKTTSVWVEETHIGEI